MTRRDLNLNSLGRYAKQSSRLVLEQHSHCEVPAGCGGVVLRWRSDISEVPVLVHLFCSGKSKLSIDGVAPASSEAMVTFGDHVLSVVLEDVPRDALLAISVAHSDFRLPQVSRRVGRPVDVVTDGDGKWRCATVQPADDAWTRPGFDDSAWAAMGLAPRPSLEKRKTYTRDTAWEMRLQMTLDAGAKCLRVDAPAGRMWVRRAFRLARPGEDG